MWGETLKMHGFPFSWKFIITMHTYFWVKKKKEDRIDIPQLIYLIK